MAKLQVRNRFGSVPNSVLNDETLSFKAKWLFAYIQSKPDHWDFSTERISNDSRDWRDSVRGALQELEKAKLLLRRTVSYGRGRFETEYILFESASEYDEEVNSSVTENTSSENTSSENTSSENTTTKNPTTNKERSTKQEKSKKESEIKDSNESEKTISKEEIDEISAQTEKRVLKLPISAIAVETALDVIYETQPELSDKIREFLAFRKAKKVPILPESFAAWLRKLTKLSGGRSAVAIEILDESIANGWTWIFALKEGGTWKTNVSPNKY